LAEHEELDQRIGRLLAAERRRVLGLRGAMLAVTGKAGHSALRDGFGVSGRDQESEGKGCDCCCSVHLPHSTLTVIPGRLVRGEPGSARFRVRCFSHRPGMTEYCDAITAPPPSTCRS